MDAIVSKYKVIDSWAGDRPGRVTGYLELVSLSGTIDTAASDSSAQVQAMGDGVYLLTDLPDWIDMASDRDIREFDPATWRLWPNSKLVELGYKVLDATQKLVGDDIVFKTELERMRDGVIPMPAGLKIVEDANVPGGLKPVAMTREERVVAKQISRAEADAEERAEKTAAIVKQITLLDSTCPRSVEDLYELTGKFPSGIDVTAALAAIANKKELRAQIAAL